LCDPSDWCLLVGPPEAGERASSGGPSIVYLAENVAVDMASRVIWVWKDTSIAEDRIAVEFAEVLEGLGVKYAIVADYVAILLGRSRRSEDVDFIVEPISEDAFLELAGRLRARGFALLQGDIGSVGSLRNIYNRYLKEGLGLRFTYRDLLIPNIELRLARSFFDEQSIDKAYRVILNNEHRIRISPPELQIAYKLYLGSDKDIGDARFLYRLLAPVIDRGELERWARALGANTALLGDLGGRSRMNRGADSPLSEVERVRRMNTIDILRYADWNAEIVKRMGRKWFKERDKWLEESLKADLEFMGKNPRAIEALLDALEVKAALEARKIRELGEILKKEHL